MATISKCECGKRMTKGANECKACYAKREKARNEEACRIVLAGKCPCCMLPLKRNLALTGWYQCPLYGEPQFRDPQYAALASRKCSFQIFAYFERLEAS